MSTHAKQNTTVGAPKLRSPPLILSTFLNRGVLDARGKEQHMTLFRRFMVLSEATTRTGGFDFETKCSNPAALNESLTVDLLMNLRVASVKNQSRQQAGTRYFKKQTYAMLKLLVSCAFAALLPPHLHAWSRIKSTKPCCTHGMKIDPILLLLFV